MTKIHIWLGTFDNEGDFEKYFDTTPYLRAWAKYNNEPPKDGDTNTEPDDELVCDFCKEIGVTTIDEDFLYAFYEPSGNFDLLLSRIPANLKKITQAYKDKGITHANTFIVYTANELEDAHPEQSKGMIYIGEFLEATPTPLVEDENTRIGYSDIIFLGKIDTDKETFLEYFNQGDYMKELDEYQSGKSKKKPSKKFSCNFCRDINVTYYIPEYTTIYFAEEPVKIEQLASKSISHAELAERVISLVNNNQYPEKIFNVLVHIEQHKTKKANEEPKIKIYPAELLEQYTLPKGYVIEKDSYNGLRYVGNFAWE